MKRIECFLAAAGRHSHRRDFLCVNNPKGQANQTWDDVDTKLAATKSSYWVNFITKGDPNGSGRPNWPQYRNLNSKVMVLGNTVQAEAAPPVDKLKFFAEAYQRLIRPGAN